MEQQLELFITVESQEKLEQDIRKNLGTLLMEDDLSGMTSHVAGKLYGIQKNLIEYFDNTRLLQNQPKEKVEL